LPAGYCLTAGTSGDALYNSNARVAFLAQADGRLCMYANMAGHPRIGDVPFWCCNNNLAALSSTSTYPNFCFCTQTDGNMLVYGSCSVTAAGLQIAGPTSGPAGGMCGSLSFGTGAGSSPGSFVVTDAGALNINRASGAVTTAVPAPQ
jgi:hypothetical protein